MNAPCKRAAEGGRGLKPRRARTADFRASSGGNRRRAFGGRLGGISDGLNLFRRGGARRALFPAPLPVRLKGRTKCRRPARSALSPKIPATETARP